MGKYREYLEVKKSLNTDPTQPLTSAHEEHLMRLIQDFLAEIPGSFLDDVAETFLDIVYDARE